MTKRDRLSFALRRLRDFRAGGNPVVRVQETHRIIKEVIDELSKGTQNADLAHHVIELLDEFYDQHTGILEDGQIPAFPIMPDYSAQIRPHIDTLIALSKLDDPDAVTAAAAMALYETLSVFSQGPNASAIHALLNAFDRVTGAK